MVEAFFLVSKFLESPSTDLGVNVPVSGVGALRGGTQRLVDCSANVHSPATWPGRSAARASRVPGSNSTEATSCSTPAVNFAAMAAEIRAALNVKGHKIKKLIHVFITYEYDMDSVRPTYIYIYGILGSYM